MTNFVVINYVHLNYEIIITFSKPPIFYIKLLTTSHRTVASGLYKKSKISDVINQLGVKDKFDCNQLCSFEL
jgi:hypothetical protein